MSKAHRIDLEELKITYQLKEMDLNQRLARAQERIAALEKSHNFDDVLATYDTQISQLESTNNLLLDELRKVMRFHSSQQQQTESKTIKH